MPPHPLLQRYAHSAMASDLRLFYYDAGVGDETPIVLVHGLGDEADTWAHVLPQLARRRRVIAPDLPGKGRSDAPHRAFTLAFLASAVAGLLDTLGIARAVLVGHSLGAAVVQRLALAQPDRAERLVLIDGGLPIAPRRPPRQLWPLLAPGMGEAIYTSLRRSQDAAYDTLRPYYYALDGLPADDRAFLRERVSARVWSGSQRRAFFSMLRWLAVDQATRADGFRARLARMTTPTRLVWGEHDALQPLAYAAALEKVIPHAELHVIPECGHNAQQEHPDEVAALIQGG
jgi:pimeloyl-ACP methyl ester carboxylesterase